MYKHFLINYSARVLQSQYLIVQPPFYFDWDQVCVGLLQHDAASQKERVIVQYGGIWWWKWTGCVAVMKMATDGEKKLGHKLIIGKYIFLSA